MTDDGDPHEQIAHLEEEIEEFGKTLERCRKAVLVSKIAIPAGAMAFLAMALSILPFDPIAMMVAIAAALGGTVLFGSNTSTLQQTKTAMKAAETLRAELIGRINLRVVGNGAWRGRNGG
jgi:hypothetical protein